MVEQHIKRGLFHFNWNLKTIEATSYGNLQAEISTEIKEFTCIQVFKTFTHIEVGMWKLEGVIYKRVGGGYDGYMSEEGVRHKLLPAQGWFEDFHQDALESSRHDGPTVWGYRTGIWLSERYKRQRGADQLLMGELQEWGCKGADVCARVLWAKNPWAFPCMGPHWWDSGRCQVFANWSSERNWKYCWAPRGVGGGGGRGGGIRDLSILWGNKQQVRNTQGWNRVSFKNLEIPLTSKRVRLSICPSTWNILVQNDNLLPRAL